MKKQQKRHRFIATFFLLIFFPTLVPIDLFASTNGPKSPEAASFEPVDATDMVNLVTGQYSYVLPVMNVPGPEGGYPITMGYHAGIGFDQEASWTGLGWNLNPGSINRNVNGYPDDYIAELEEYFYDQGGTESVNTLSLGYSNGGGSVAVGFSWGSNQALSGHVSIGVGFETNGIGVGANVTAGTNGGSAGIGIITAGGLTVGINATSSGEGSINIGQLDTNGAGFNISTDGSFSVKSNSVSINASSYGIGISLMTKSKGNDNSGGVGLQLAFERTISMGDYTFEQSGWSIPLIIPTPVGVFSLSYGKTKYKYYLATRKDTYVTGPLYFSEFSTGADEVGNSLDSFEDIREISLIENESELSSKTDVAKNNITLPNYDNFSIQAQGISGSIAPVIFKNGAIAGLSNNDISNGYESRYMNNMKTPFENPQANYFLWSNSATPESLKMDYVNFYFENEISTYLNYTDVNPPTYNNLTNNPSIGSFFNVSSASVSKPKRKTAAFIDFFTNMQLKDANSMNYYHVAERGYLKPSQDIGPIPYNSQFAIGAFQITSEDGKVYHYSLPVYNNEIITRTHGAIANKPEGQSYFEKRQLTPYVTHWLLTAVTGPDFVDNGDGKVGTGDLGYWTSFEYGKLTDAFVWKAPYKKDFIQDEDNPDIKTWIRGRKQLYYLDRIKTRTHTAIFIKSERAYENSEQWAYHCVKHNNNASSDENYFNSNNPFTIPSQNQLKLDKIILVKNEDDIVDKSNVQQSSTMDVVFPQSHRIHMNAQYNCKKNIIDNADNWNAVMPKAIKVIDFTYDNSLAQGDPRLTLKQVEFKGKAGSSVLPPYKFDYFNSVFNVDDKDDWGFVKSNPNAYSLRQITTPQGSQIKMYYEPNTIKTVSPYELIFSNKNLYKYKSTLPDFTNGSMSNKKVIIDVGGSNQYPITLNHPVKINYTKQFIDGGQPLSRMRKLEYIGDGHITQIISPGKYEVTFNNNVQNIEVGILPLYSPAQILTEDIKVRIMSDPNGLFTCGIRVFQIEISGDNNRYISEYKYGENENGIGYVSYLPYSQNISKEIAYSADLPAPRPMYEYVTFCQKNSSGQSLGKIKYKFNIMKEKTPNEVEYGNFYKITKNTNSLTNIANNGSAGTWTADVKIDQYTIHNNIASIGQLLEITTYNSFGQIFEQIQNEYYKPTDVIPNNMGVKQESYQSFKIIDYHNSNVRDKWLINSSTRITFPSIIKSSKELKDGYTYITEFKNHDLISGIAKETESTTSDGKSLKTKIVPAYTKYAAMGSKVDNINNKNMLSQTAAEYSYIWDTSVASADKWRVTGVGITTWNNVWSYKDIGGNTSNPANEVGVWRKHKTYTWNGAVDPATGIFTNFNNTNNDDDGFVWGVGLPQTNTRWKQLSEVTLYDHYSMALEAKDINGNKASTKMGDNDTKIMATGNAGYNEMFYAGGENLTPNTTWLEPEVRLTDASQQNSTYYHTGKKCVSTTNTLLFGVDMKANQHRAGKYKISVWVEKTNEAKARIKDNGTIVPFTESYTAGNWVLKSGYVNVLGGDYSIYVTSVDGSTVYYDDLMIRPVASSITGYVYNEWDELTYIIGNNGLATKFVYDNAGRLIQTHVEVVDDPANQLTGGFKLKSTNTIKYKNL